MVRTNPNASYSVNSSVLDDAAGELALVSSSTAPFVNRETHGEEIHDSFAERPDFLQTRLTFKDNANMFAHYARGRKDNLKGYSYLSDKASEVRELEFYPDFGSSYAAPLVRYRHEKVSTPEGPWIRLSCTFAPLAEQYHGKSFTDEIGASMASQTLHLFKGKEFNVETDSIATLKSLVARMSEGFHPSVKQRWVRYDRDISGHTATAIRWPLDPILRSKCLEASGDSDAESMSHNVYTFDQFGGVISVANEDPDATKKDVTDVFSWISGRENDVLETFVHMERFLFMFLHSEFSSLVGDALVEDKDQRIRDLESLVQRLFKGLDARKTR